MTGSYINSKSITCTAVCCGYEMKENGSGDGVAVHVVAAENLEGTLCFITWTTYMKVHK